MNRDKGTGRLWPLFSPSNLNSLPIIQRLCVALKGWLRHLAGQPGVLLLLLHIPELFQQVVCVLSPALRGA